LRLMPPSMPWALRSLRKARWRTARRDRNGGSIALSAAGDASAPSAGHLRPRWRSGAVPSTNPRPCPSTGQ
jgi:hypothetical protein